MFKVSYEEFKNINPHIAKNILKVFKVKAVPRFDARYDATILEPMSYDEWVRDIWPSELSKELVTVLKENPQLQEYMRGVISFITENPAILNDHIKLPEDSLLNKQGLGVGADDKYMGAEGLKMQYFTHPLANSIQGYAYSAAVGLGDMGAETFRRPYGLNFAQVYPNAILNMHGGMSGAGTIMNMTGGGCGTRQYGGDFEQFRIHLESVINTAKRGGLHINRDDDVSIRNRIKTTEKTVHNVNEMVKTLALLVRCKKLADCFETNKSGGRFTNREISIEKMMSNKELIQWLSKNIGEYENCINKNMEYVNQETYEMMRTFNDLINSISTNKGQSSYQTM